MPKFNLTINFTPETGEIGINGAIENQALAYGMLDCDAISKYHIEKIKGNKIVPATTLVGINYEQLNWRKLSSRYGSYNYLSAGSSQFW